MTTVGEPVGDLLRTAGSRRRGGMPWEQAYEAAAAAEALPAVRTALKRAHGRTLAASLLAPIPHPAFDTAAMDGYAVAGPGPWTVTGRVLAGGASPGGRPLAPGQAVEIATGAPVPAGAFAVVPYELALREGQSVTAAAPADAGGAACGHDGPSDGPGGPAATSNLVRGWNIRRRGEECPAGRELLPAGTLVTPAVLGLAAAFGSDALIVHGCPRVAVLVTGDELVRTGLPPAGRVRDALGPLLPGLIGWAGGVTSVTYLPDGRAPLTSALTRATADVIVVCGASSRGPADHLRPALRELAAELVVDSVACRPGHPQLLGRLGGGTHVVGLPGNPYAALAAAMTLLVPLLGALSGRPATVRDRARLTAPPRTDPARTRLVPVTVGGTAGGATATPVGHDHPALLWGAATADALAVVPPGGAAEVDLLPLPC